MKNSKKSSLLRDFITIKRATGAVAFDGTKTFTNVLKTFGQIEEKSGDEKFESSVNARYAKNFAVLKIRKPLAAVRGQDRVEARGRTWEVASLPREISTDYVEIDIEEIE